MGIWGYGRDMGYEDMKETWGYGVSQTHTVLVRITAIIKWQEMKAESWFA